MKLTGELPQQLSGSKTIIPYKYHVSIYGMEGADATFCEVGWAKTATITEIHDNIVKGYFKGEVRLSYTDGSGKEISGAFNVPYTR
ncbi:MAG: hypothetical protein ABWZ25_12955 [Chitinophagaceae bacterium]